MLNPTAPIHQFMMRSVLTVTPETALSRARELMEQNKLRYLPVVSAGQVVGILNARSSVVMDDFGIFTSEEGTVQAAMMAAPACIPPSIPLRDVVHTMAHEDLAVVLVVDGGGLRGMFTDADALKLLANVLTE